MIDPIRAFPPLSLAIGEALVLAPRKFHDKTLWPEYLALSAELEKHLADLTERVIREAIHDDVSEANEEEPKGLPEPGP